MEMRKVSLENIGKPGLVPELFDHELAKVLANIADVNTETKTKRKILIEIEFTPDNDRQNLGLKIGVTSKLAPIPKQDGVAFVRDKRFGVTEAYVQMPLEEKPLFDNVEQMEAKDNA